MSISGAHWILTECQSGSTFATLSVTIKSYKNFIAELSFVIDSSGTVLNPIAEAMYAKLKKYEALICLDITELLLILD